MTSLHTLLVLVTLMGQDGPPVVQHKAEPNVAIDLARLRELLYSRQEPREQSQAALLLVQNQSPEAADLVIAGLRRQDRPDVYQALTAAIRLQHDSRFIDPLIEGLDSDQNLICESAKEALARLDPVLVVPRLLSQAEDESVPLAARQKAAATLGRAVHKSAAVALMSLLSSEASGVGQAAAEALEEMTGLAHGRNVFQWQSWWERQKDIKDEEWLSARIAYQTDRARRLQSDLQQAETHIVQLQQSLYSKVPLADRPNHLRTVMQSPYAAVRGQAITWAIELLPDAEAATQKVLVDLLLHLSTDGVEQVQRQAVLALEKVNDPRAFERLLVVLQSPNVNVRAAAARSLGRYHSGPSSETVDLNASAIAALGKALGDPSLVVVAEAAESLGSLGAPEAAPVLADLLHHPSDTVRQAAARALEPMANPAVLPQVFAGLADGQAGVRFSLVGSLGKIGAADGNSGERADILKRLEQVLVRDGDPGVRSRAATVIGDLGTASQLQPLWQRVRATEDSRVQLKAWSAMLDILSRSVDLELIRHWDQTLAQQKQLTHRVEMLTEIRSRWAKLEAAKPHLDDLTGMLVEGLLSQRKCSQAMPLAQDLAKRPATETQRTQRLRWLLTAGNQALEENKPQEVLDMLKEMHDCLAKSGDLAAEFEALRQRASTSPKP